MPIQFGQKLFFLTSFYLIYIYLIVLVASEIILPEEENNCEVLGGMIGQMSDQAIAKIFKDDGMDQYLENDEILGDCVLLLFTNNYFESANYMIEHGLATSERLNRQMYQKA